MKTGNFRWKRRGHWHSRAAQKGQAQQLFLLFLLGIGLLFVVVYGVAFWLGKGIKGKLAGFVVATALLSPIWHPFIRSTQDSEHRDANRQTAAKRCTEELAALPEQFAVDSVLDETGGMRAEDISHLLLSLRLKFVEVKLDARRILAPGDGDRWMATGDGFARMELADAGSPSCFVKDPAFADSFFTNLPPVKPGTCMTVTYAERPGAAIAVAERPEGEFSRWEMRRLPDGARLASVTDSLRSAGYTDGPPRWVRYNGPNGCSNGSSGYGMLMDRIRPADPGHAAQRILTTGTLTLDGGPGSVKEFEALLARPGVPRISFSEVKPAKPLSGHGWKEAYAQAEKHRAWIYQGNSLIRPSVNTLSRLERKGVYGNLVAVGDRLFLVHFGAEGRPDGLVIFDGAGRYVGVARVEAPAHGDAVPEGFVFREFEWTDGFVVAHGTGLRPDTPWSFRFPRGELEALLR